ncbi:TIGR04283 family arsenosugar biosynthesis glycosyltransferase [Marinobacter sp. M3C]|uniref:TIGR04283 family arsenosugar biosynthesis glycosyltransferase n=1 Tax=Marinobacter sp. M3C TaxID=2917715 RepID=UPI00200F9AFE|nr:TIGR04283 family arsenosugar biosynthesis glycosyltransferase [Marinobacter sp. M3C]UQG61312.1 TIGR04283 family arsenosugar biosynthesis glycosyltransferase [Marinobacter sp. M3C]
MTDLKADVKLSVIVPVWNEATAIGALLQSLQLLQAQGHEVIVADGGSTDGTQGLARLVCDQLVSAELGRSAQMNAGAAVAQGDVLLFLHADTMLPADAVQQLQAFLPTPNAWGRFDVRLSGSRPLFRVISWFMNKRSRLTGICTGDQAMFVRRDTFEALGGFSLQPLMEDVELSRRLRDVSRPFCVPSPVTTDSRRWQQQGAWATIVLMWRLRWRYWRGESAESLAQAYRLDVRNAQ